jgi:superkiller protein 3
MSSRILIRISIAILLSALLIPHLAGQNAKPALASSALTKAKLALSKHDLNSAEALIWEVLNAQPNNAQALFLLGVVRGEQQRFAEAETLFQRVVQIDPKFAEAHLNLGKVYLSENKLPEATEQYHQAEELAPHNIEVRVTLARLYAANGQFRSAMTSLEAIPPARLPEEAIPVKVGCMLALGRQSEAMKLAAEASNPAVKLASAEVFVTSNLPKEALKLLDSAAASGRRPPARFYFVKARALDETGDETGAVENFKKAIALAPNSEEFLLALAERYARHNNHVAAFDVLKGAYKLDPNSPKVLRPLIVEASFAGKTPEVQDAAEQLSKSDDPQDLFVSADVFLTTVRQDEAVPLLEKYLAKVPNDPRAWVGLGVGYEDQKRFADAQKAFEKAIEVDPKFADAEYQLGVLISLTGNSALAMQHYERAVQLNPQHGQALEKLGNAYLEAGQFEKARDMLLRAEIADPHNRKVEYGLALAYSKLGNREEAKVHMERFQKAGPIGATEKK